jgi:Ca2+-binding EF-hand superfamily protein
MRLLLLAMSLFAFAAVFAQEKPTAPKEESASGGATAPQPSFRRDASASRALFDRLDKNRDGYLTGTELTSQEALTANWLGVDRDADGRISREEFTAVPQTESASAGPTRRE